MTREELAARIEHTLLRPDATADAVERLCAEAVAGGFLAVCVHPLWVAAARRALGEAPVRVTAVVGFPTGAHEPEVKALEARRAVGAGAAELDMVAALGALRARDDDAFSRDVAAVVEAAGGAPVKVILETGLFDPDTVAAGARLAREAGARFVKTSTGFGPRGATPDDVRLLREAVGASVGIKAAGGIRSAAAAQALIAAGADRIGTSWGPAIVDELPPRSAAT